MSDSIDTPRLRWFFGTAEQRQRAFKYWGEDVLIGALDLLIHYGMRSLPIDWCSKIGTYLGVFGRVRYPDSDDRARRAWRKLRPDDADDAATEKAVTNVWRCVGRTMGEYSVLGRFWRAERINVQGVEHLDAARASGTPRLIMALHLGNWETIAPTLMAVGHPGSGIYLPPDNRFDHFIARKVREAFGAILVPPSTHATREGFRVLKADEGVFVIYVDEFVRGRVQSPALGRPIRHSGTNMAYVARLAAMTGAAVIPAYCVRKGDSAHFDVHFLAPVELQRTGNRGCDAKANVDRLDAVVDPIIRAHLDQWFYVLDLEIDEP
jgi:KDO2-lipid IV(A) lauroyltransferase